MAASRCPHCKGTHFELKTTEPAGASYVQCFIQCATCGAPAGATGYYDAGTLVKLQEKRLQAMETQLRAIDYNVQAIIGALNQRMRA